MAMAAACKASSELDFLSFWTVGDTLTMTSTGTDQKAYQMTMSKGDSRYEVHPKRMLFAEKGTELKISPLLEGIRTLSGEKIQWYLASELRDRIRDSKARVTVIDKLARKQYEVEPRQFEGRLLHQLPAIRTVFGDAYAELYLAEPNEAARVALDPSRNPGDRGFIDAPRIGTFPLDLALRAGSHRCAVPESHARYSQWHHSGRALCGLHRCPSAP